MSARQPGRRMKLVACSIALLPLSAVAQAPSPEASCPIPGDRFAWTTDYCLALNQTDDETLAGPCIDQELQRRFVDACQGVTYYKEALCALAVERGSISGRVDDCVADDSFSGPTVRRKLAAAAPRP
jgi:hypothetical protein